MSTIPEGLLAPYAASGASLWLPFEATAVALGQPSHGLSA